MPRAKKVRVTDVGGRERLLATALRAFAAKGYAATSVREILRAAGVTAPVLYYHFGNKEGLFLALVQKGVEKLDAAVADAVASADTAVGRIRAYCHAAAAIRREHADLAWVVEAINSNHPDATPFFDVRAVASVMIERLADVVRAGITSGELQACDPLHAALALLGTVEMVRRPLLLAPDAPSLDDQLQGMLTLVLAGITPSPGSSAPRAAARPAPTRKRK